MCRVLLLALLTGRQPTYATMFDNAELHAVIADLEEHLRGLDCAAEASPSLQRVPAGTPAPVVERQQSRHVAAQR